MALRPKDAYTIGTVAALTITELIGDSAMKIAADQTSIGQPNFIALATGIVSYGLLSMFIYTSDSMGLLWGVSNSYWNAVNNLVTPAVFMLFFRETYTTTQWIGFGVISLGILIVGMGSSSPL